MRLAMIGLGRMGGNMVERLLLGGHQVVVYDRSMEAVAASVAKGAKSARDLADLCAQLDRPRAVWVMVPSGAPTQQTIDELLTHLEPGDILIDGGNSNFRDSMRRAEAAQAKGVEFIDAGTSGGVWGLQVGYCLMIGATEGAFATCEPIFRTLAPEQGYARMGPPGSGHYVKMVHNGIEYGLLQAYAEGYEILHASKDFKLDCTGSRRCGTGGAWCVRGSTSWRNGPLPTVATWPSFAVTWTIRVKGGGPWMRRCTSTYRRR